MDFKGTSWARNRQDERARGPREGYESLIVVLVATVRCPSGRAPHQTDLRPQDQEDDGVTGSLGTIFTLASRPRSGHRN